MDTNILNIKSKYLSMMVLICIKKQLSKFEAQFMKKLSNTEAEVKKKALLIKKSVYIVI